MRKAIVTSLIIICTIFGSVLFFISKADIPVATENQLLETNQEEAEKSLHISTINKQQNVTYLDLIKIPFDPNLIELYTGKPMKFEKYTLDDVSDGVYVTRVQAHSGKQILTIYSKDETAKTKNLKVIVEENTLKIFIEEEKANTHREKHIVYQTDTFGTPARYKVFRNDKSEKSEGISYAIE